MSLWLLKKTTPLRCCSGVDQSGQDYFFSSAFAVALALSSDFDLSVLVASVFAVFVSPAFLVSEVLAGAVAGLSMVVFSVIDIWERMFFIGPGPIPGAFSRSLPLWEAPLFLR